MLLAQYYHSDQIPLTKYHVKSLVHFLLAQPLVSTMCIPCNIFDIFYSVVSINVQGPVMMPLDHYSSFSLTCTLTLAPQVNDFVVEMNWSSPDLIPFNSTTDGGIVLNTLEPTMISINDSVVYTLTLNFSSLQASQVGEYVCRASLNDSTDIITLTSNYSISVQGNYYMCIL